jgi:glycosyltransferase involved in cell wall biosynthesis
MPVYNTRRYLRQSVESILSQTFGDFELIIIDDGSTDGSTEILKEFQQGDSRIRLISRPNTGISRALNEALSLASGDLLARMDSDDIALPCRFEKQVAYLREHPECVALGCCVREIDPHGIPLGIIRNQLDHDQILQALLKGYGAHIPHPAVMMRRLAVLDVGGYRVEFQLVEDLDLYLRLAERGRLANLPDVLLEYRQHFASVNYRRYFEQIRLASLVVAEALARRGQIVPASFTLPGWPEPMRLERYRNWVWAALQSGRFAVAWRVGSTSVGRAPVQFRLGCQ